MTVVALEINTEEVQSDDLKHRTFVDEAICRGLNATRHPSRLADDGLAYLLFISGSTGVPKAVSVPHFNLRELTDSIGRCFPLSFYDRVSQTFDLTFAPSILDIFSALTQGACLYPLSDRDVLFPAKFIRSKQIHDGTAIRP